MRLATKTALVLLGLLTVGAAQAYVNSPRHVVRVIGTTAAAVEVPLLPPVEAAMPQPPTSATVTEQDAARALDSNAKPAHNVSAMTGKTAGKRGAKVRSFVCDPPAPMQRNPNGIGHVEYGRVSRCEWM